MPFNGPGMVPPDGRSCAGPQALEEPAQIDNRGSGAPLVEALRGWIQHGAASTGTEFAWISAALGFFWFFGGICSPRPGHPALAPGRFARGREFAWISAALGFVWFSGGISSPRPGHPALAPGRFARGRELAQISAAVGFVWHCSPVRCGTTGSDPRGLGLGFARQRSFNHHPLTLCSMGPCDRGNLCRRRPAGEGGRRAGWGHRRTGQRGLAMGARQHRGSKRPVAFTGLMRRPDASLRHSTHALPYLRRHRGFGPAHRPDRCGGAGADQDLRPGPSHHLRAPLRLWTGTSAAPPTAAPAPTRICDQDLRATRTPSRQMQRTQRDGSV